MTYSQEKSPVFRLLSELLSVPSPSGREEKLAGLVRRRVEKLGFAPETDAAGNVLVRLEGSGNSGRGQDIGYSSPGR